MTDFSKEQISSGLEALAPFHHKISLPYDLTTYLEKASRRKRESTRFDVFVKHAFPEILKASGGSLEGKKVLDVACNCGGFSFEAVKQGCDSVLGFDIVDRYIEQANFVKKVNEVKNAEFKVKNINNLDPNEFGMFDVTLCLGILYHLENPVDAMKKIAAMTKEVMIVDTNTIPNYLYSLPFSKKPMWLMNTLKQSSSDASDISTSLWRSGGEVIQFRPNEYAVVELLKFLGFSKIKKLSNFKPGLEKRYYAGKRMTFIASR